MLLITRPIEEASKLKLFFEKHGQEAHVDPLLTIEYKDYAPLPTHAFQGVIITSQHVLPWLQRHKRKLSKEITVFTVGPRTGKIALEMGFANVIIAGHSVDSLISKVREHGPDISSLLYPSGSIITKDLEYILKKHGIHVNRIIVYHALAATRMKEETLSLMDQERIKAVTLLSTRTAKIFINLAKKEHFALQLEKVAALCGSVNIKSVCENSIKWRCLKTLKNLSENEILNVYAYILCYY